MPSSPRQKEVETKKLTDGSNLHLHETRTHAHTQNQLRRAGLRPGTPERHSTHQSYAPDANIHTSVNAERQKRNIFLFFRFYSLLIAEAVAGAADVGGLTGDAGAARRWAW